MLIVNTLTNACFDYDARGPAGGQVSLYSCGGSPDGSGSFAASQIFPFDGRRGPHSLRPGNGPGKCLVVKGGVVDIADCKDSDAAQEFTFDGEGTAATTVTAKSTPTEIATTKSTTTEVSTAKETTTLPVTAKSTSSKLTTTRSAAVESTITTKSKYRGWRKEDTVYASANEG